MKNNLGVLLTFFSVLISTLSLFSQTSQISSSSYNRNSLSFHYVEFSPALSYSKKAYDMIDVPEKYDDNTIADNVIKLNMRVPAIDGNISLTLKNAIKDQKVVNKILANILLDSKGVPTVAKLAERGLYNATDRDYLISQSAKEGISLLQQYGLETMLERIYFMVIIPYSFHYGYDKDRQCYGYKTAYKSFLYHLDIKNMLDSNFWELFWWEGYDQDKLDYFMNYDFPIKALHMKQGTMFAEKENHSILEIQFMTLSSIINNHMINIEQENEELQIKTPVFSVSPIASKIGKKEGLKIDNLYKVTEFRQERDGEISERKVGHVRVKHVADNRHATTGESEMSLFYKAPAGNVKKGMSLTEVPEFGSMTGFEVGFRGSFIPINDSDRFMYVGIVFEQITHMWKGNRIAGGYNYLMNMETGGYCNLFTVEIKQELQMNRISIVPGIGFGYAYQKSQSIKVPGAIASLKIALNLGKYFQIHAGPKLFYFLDDSMNGLYLTAGLRLFGF